MATTPKKRNFDFSQEATTPSPQIAQRTRHLRTRLSEYFCVEVIDCQEEKGILTLKFLGFMAETIKTQLSKVGVTVKQQQHITFYVTEDHPFEDIDAVYGVFMGILL